MNDARKQYTTENGVLPSFSYSFQSGEFAVRDALARFIDELSPLDLDVEEKGTIELVLAEALNNIVEHAYPAPEPAGQINVSCVHGKDGLHVEITDTGYAMPDGRPPVGELSPIDGGVDDLPEGGFGWFLIQSLAKDVTYQRRGNVNELNLRLAIGTTH